MGAASRVRLGLVLVIGVVTPTLLPVTGTQLADAAAAASPLSPVGGVPPLPAGAVAKGNASPDTHLQLAIVLRSSDPAGLVETAQSVSTPGSAYYRHFLSPSEVQQSFGPPAGAAQEVESYLEASGLKTGPTLGDGLLLTAGGPASAVVHAMHTRIVDYQETSGSLVYANTSAPEVPSTIAGAIVTVNGLDDVNPFEPNVVRDHSPPSTSNSAARSSSSAHAVSGAATPCSDASKVAASESAYTADELASTYGTSSIYQAGDLGQKVGVALVELAGFSKSDISTFEECYGIKTKVTTKRIDGGAGIGRDTLETELDIEDLASMAPGVSIHVFETTPTTGGVLTAYGTVATDSRVKVVSVSFGSCEPLALQSFVQGEASLFDEMAMQGESVVAASGDTGSEDCYDSDGSVSLAVGDPASQPNGVTAVGGTDLKSSGSPPSEVVWNDDTGSSGGGASSEPGNTMPSWQIGPGVVGPWSNTGHCGEPLCREVPDVAASASADNGYVVYCTAGNNCAKKFRGWSAVGGTSAAAPLWAAVFALADEGLITKSCARKRVCPTIGFANMLLYEIAANPSQQGAFNSVTSGNNDYTKTNLGLYPSSSNYDMATGLGSPNADVLVPLLQS